MDNNLSEDLYEYKPYTEEQEAHLKTLEERVSELEQELFKQVATISRHIQSALDDGMEEYRTFMIYGYISFQPDETKTPKSIADKLMDVFPHTVVLTVEGRVEEDLRLFKESIDDYDWHYLAHPEEYPADYKPKSRAYGNFIVGGMAHDKFSIDDLMAIGPEDIISQVKIYI